MILEQRSPNRSVDKVSMSLYADGEQLITRLVRELPPKLFCQGRKGEVEVTSIVGGLEDAGEFAVAVWYVLPFVLPLHPARSR